MYDESEIIQTKWNGKTRKYYENLGYTYTKYNDLLYVTAKDLIPSSATKIHAICTYCNTTTYISKYNYMKHTDNDTVPYVCSEQSCKTKKLLYRLTPLREKQFQIFLDFCAEHNYTPISVIDDYKDNTTPLYYICPKHGKQSNCLTVIKHGGACNECGNEIIGHKLSLSIKEVCKRINSINNNILLNPQDYKCHNVSNLKVLCGICKVNTFTVSLVSYEYSHIDRCRVCSHEISKAELEISRYLDSINIKYKTEFRFNDCRDKKPLPFDFYLTEYNICIEFDGWHHYHPIYGEERLKLTQLHDKIKDQYCFNNHIPLLRIPYWEYQNFKEIINSFLSINRKNIA